MDKKTIERKLNLCERRIKSMEGYSSKTHTYDGGFSLGYQVGKKVVLEELLEDLEYEEEMTHDSNS